MFSKHPARVWLDVCGDFSGVLGGSPLPSEVDAWRTSCPEPAPNPPRGFRNVRNSFGINTLTPPTGWSRIMPESSNSRTISRAGAGRGRHGAPGCARDRHSGRVGRGVAGGVGDNHPAGGKAGRRPGVAVRIGRDVHRSMDVFRLFVWSGWGLAQSIESMMRDSGS